MNTLPMFEPQDVIVAEGGSDDWATPPSEAAVAVDVFRGVVDVDPATNANAIRLGLIPARRAYTKAEDGLSKVWTGNVWINPPYSEIGPWVERVRTEFANRAIDCQMLVKHDHTTDWFQRAYESATAMAMLRRRVTFVGLPGQPSETPPFGVTVFGWFRGARAARRFVRLWEEHGAYVIEGEA